MADLGTKMDQSQIPITLAIATAKIRKRKWNPTHKRALEIYQDKKKPKLEVDLQRSSGSGREAFSLYTLA